MADRHPPRGAALTGLVWPVRLTLAGLFAERVTRGFWPVWTLLFAAIAALGFGVQDVAPLDAVWIGGLFWLAALGWFLWSGIRAFRLPTRDEALARIDATLPGRPIAALTDAQATGQADAASVHVWKAHVARMAARAAGAAPVAPDLRVSRRDPFALRYAALAAVLMALAFGSIWRVGEVASLASGTTGTAVASGPAWEGWIEPPRYTGKPSLYLNDIDGDRLEVPEGSTLTLRLYAGEDELAFTQSVGDLPPPPAPYEGAEPATVTVRAIELEILRSGRIEIGGDGGRSWTVTVLPDAAPSVGFDGDIGRDAEGQLSQPFKAADDYAVASGTARVELDLGHVTRRHGLTPDPDPQEPLVFDLPLPITGNRADFAETLVEDASKHPWANMPVRMTLTVTDGREQTGTSETREMVLPGRRFFDPLANAVAEMRRDLLWTRANGPRVAQVLHAFTHRPEGFIDNERAYLMLRVAMRRLDAGLAQGTLSPALRDETAEALWEIALLLEDGGLSDALARMQEAQERLSEAIRNGASPEEIQRLMDELRSATDNYIRELAENAEREEQGLDEPGQEQAQNEGQQITGDQLQEMMDEIQRLMEEGRMAEAQELLEQLQRLMENLRVTQGEGGKGQQGQGGQAMRDLQDTLRRQQGLSDETFGELQNQFGQGQQGQEGQEGQDGQGRPGQARPGTGEGGPDENGESGSLADRQEALREELRRQSQGTYPGADSPEGEAARRQLDEAGRAMEEAEEALRDGDNSTALDRQAEAIERLREGMRNMGEAMAQGNPNPDGQQGEEFGDRGSEVPRDPLGRATGRNGQTGTDEDLLQGEDVYRRARDLLDEIRRRSGERGRPEDELDYLKRLLGPF